MSDFKVTNSTLLSKKVCEEDIGYDDIDDLEYCFKMIMILGDMIVQFGEKYLKLKFSDDVEKDKVAVEAVYKQFLIAPSKDLTSMSTSIKMRIIGIPDIDGFDDIIDRLSGIYVSYCEIKNNPHYFDLLENHDKNGLRSLLIRAPPIKESDDELCSIFNLYL